jgi:hypothetical protein
MKLREARANWFQHPVLKTDHVVNVFLKGENLLISTQTEGFLCSVEVR